MEIYVFVRMGGTTDDMVIKTIGDFDIATLPTNFDANKARCFLNIDRQRLLAVIESSFGTLDPFNKRVRAIMDEKLHGKKAGTQRALTSQEQAASEQVAVKVVSD